VEAISSKVQMELSELDEADRRMFMEELGVAGFALDRVIKKSYELLGLISFLTGNENEVHAWAVKQGIVALKAAGAIHKDFERGFIKAEVIPFVKLAEVKSESEAKKRGWMRLEGKDYVVQDGDVIYFRFNV
jgi:ribosome-binding ATPase YchF (GTP1/OBG family)